MQEKSHPGLGCERRTGCHSGRRLRGSYLSHHSGEAKMWSRVQWRHHTSRQQEALLWSPEAMSRGMTGNPFQPRWPSNADKIKGSIASVSSMVVLSTG